MRGVVTAAALACSCWGGACGDDVGAGTGEAGGHRAGSISIPQPRRVRQRRSRDGLERSGPSPSSYSTGPMTTHQQPSRSSAVEGAGTSRASLTAG